MTDKMWGGQKMKGWWFMGLWLEQPGRLWDHSLTQGIWKTQEEFSWHCIDTEVFTGLLRINLNLQLDTEFKKEFSNRDVSLEALDLMVGAQIKGRG